MGMRTKQRGLGGAEMATGTTWMVRDGNKFSLISKYVQCMEEIEAQVYDCGHTPRRQAGLQVNSMHGWAVYTASLSRDCMTPVNEDPSTPRAQCKTD